MSNPFFQFKQFTIRHDKCAMKVGTDGVLLGAWAGTESCSRILDVGTGTGLIALMLAQRSKAVVDAIDIDADACLQAQENAESSLFAGRINVFHSDLVDFAQASTHLYDLIVSNPPYFVDSLKCPNLQRNTARHTDTLTLEDLLQYSRKLLAPQGRIALILPYDQKDRLTDCIQTQNLFLSDSLPGVQFFLSVRWNTHRTGRSRLGNAAIAWPCLFQPFAFPSDGFFLQSGSLLRLSGGCVAGRFVDGVAVSKGDALFRLYMRRSNSDCPACRDEPVGMDGGGCGLRMGVLGGTDWMGKDESCI